jgi:hypothetical protein
MALAPEKQVRRAHTRSAKNPGVGSEIRDHENLQTTTLILNALLPTPHTVKMSTVSADLIWQISRKRLVSRLPCFGLVF